jgi:hypothetical protein
VYCAGGGELKKSAPADLVIGIIVAFHCDFGS